MDLDWLNVPLDTSVSELIARGRRARAIEALRERLTGRFAPSPEIRLQLVDLLVEAGRADEAVPILLGLSDEFAKDGFVAKAIAALKRIDTLDPGRADVEARLAKLAHVQLAAEPEPELELELAPDEADEVVEADPVVDVEPDAFEEEFALAPLPAPAFPPGFEDLPPEPVVEIEAELVEEVLEVVPASEETALQVRPELSEAAFRTELLDIAEAVATQPAPSRPDPVTRARVLAHAERLLASALFKDLDETELLGVVQGLRLQRHEAGDIVVLEGEKSEGLFIVVTGAVKVFVRSPTGRNVAVASLPEGQFFGEIASLSGRARSATVTAAARTELLVLDAAALLDLTTRHPRVGRILEDSYVERASSPDVAAVRSVRLADPELRQRAGAILAAHFGQSRWDPRMKLRLSDLLLKTGKEDDAVAVLVGLADDLSREGFPEKAVAVLRKIERIRKRNIEEVSLAPLIHFADDEGEPEVYQVSAPGRVATDDFFQAWIVDVLRDRLHRTPAEPLRGYSPGLKASPLLTGLDEDARVELIQSFKLRVAGPGDILLSEGEPGDSLFVLAAGSVRVFVSRGPARGARPMATLDAGAFFGEIGALAGGVRIATVVAAERCELLELDRAGLERVGAAHPRLRELLQAAATARADASRLPRE